MNFKKKNNFITEEKVHYKMFKSGKHWLVAGITSLGIILSLAGTSAVVNANHSESIVDNAFNLSTNNVKPLTIPTDIQSGDITVDANNFADYFNINGNASWDRSTSTLTLTQDETYKTGVATLKNKVSVNNDFYLKGEVNLGNKSFTQGGGEGIALTLHNDGDNLFGFKLNTHWNDHGKYDPKRFIDQSFGAFTYSRIEGINSIIYTYNDVDAPAQKISEPTNNQFLPFEASYSGSTHVLTVKYDGKTWSKSVYSWLSKDPSLSLSIVGKTSNLNNLQQFKLDTFRYTECGVVNTKFVDEDENEFPGKLPQISAKIGETVRFDDAFGKIHEIESKGFYLEGAVLDNGKGFNPDYARIKVTEKPQTITYKFAKLKTSIKLKNATIYEGDEFSPYDCIVEATDKDGSALDFSKIKIADRDFNPNKSNTYQIHYLYIPTNLWGMSFPSVSDTAIVHVTPRKYIYVDYVDQNNNPIDPSLLSDIPKEMKPGKHSGKFGSQFTISAPNFIGNQYKLAKVVGNSNKVTFGHEDEKVTLIYQKAETGKLTVHFKNAKTGKPIFDHKPIGFIGDDLSLDPNGEYITNALYKYTTMGYHYASGDELYGKTQTSSVKFTNEHQEVTVYVAGDKVDPHARNGVVVHHYLEGTETKVLEDTHIGGNIGDKITVNPADPEHNAPAGYTRITNNPQYRTLELYEGNEVIIYYKENKGTWVTVRCYNAKTGDQIMKYPAYGKNGEVLDLTENSDFIKNIFKDYYLQGYHYATGDELYGKTQTSSVKFTNDYQDIKVYVAGDKVDPHARNGVVVHHYLEGTETKVLEDTYYGGNIGDKITVNPADPEHNAPAGYTRITNDPQYWRLELNEGKEFTIYYKENSQNNMTVNFINAANDTVVYTDKHRGKIGDTLDLSRGSDYIREKIGTVEALKGYRHASTRNELKGHNPSPSPKYTDGETTVNVYLIGDSISKNSIKAVEVHHYLEGTTTPVPGMTDYRKGGRVGDVLTFNVNSKSNKAPSGYEWVENTEAKVQTRTLSLNAPEPVIFYYRLQTKSNIKVQFIDVNSNRSVASFTPIGLFGSTVDLSEYSNKMMPKGYHYANAHELKSDQSQPQNPTFGTRSQTVKVYVSNMIHPDSDNAAVVHHYLRVNGVNTTQTVPGMTDFREGGRFGETLVFKKSDPKQTAPVGYIMVSDQQDQSLVLSDHRTECSFYYEKISD